MVENQSNSIHSDILYKGISNSVIVLTSKQNIVMDQSWSY